MKISAQLKAIRDGVSPWAETKNGSAEIALELNHLFALLSIKPGGFRIGILWDRQEKRGEHEEAGFVDNYYRVCISFGRSLKLEKGDALTEGAEGSQPLGDLIEELRDTLRALDFDPVSTESTLDYKAARVLTDIHPNLLIDGWFIEGSLGSQMPAVNI